MRRGQHAANVTADPIERIIATGGAATNRALLQVMANVFGVDVQRLDVENSAALGAALRAYHADRLAAGEPVSWETVVGGFTEPNPGHRVSPNPKLVVIYEQLRREYAISSGSAQERCAFADGSIGSKPRTLFNGCSERSALTAAARHGFRLLGFPRRTLTNPRGLCVGGARSHHLVRMSRARSKGARLLYFLSSSHPRGARGVAWSRVRTHGFQRQASDRRVSVHRIAHRPAFAQRGQAAIGVMRSGCSRQAPAQPCHAVRRVLGNYHVLAIE